MNFIEALRCPVCNEDFSLDKKSLVCKNNHLFDISKEGYVNLLCSSHKSGSEIGDNKSMALCRQRFLNKGYFSALSDFISGYCADFSEAATILDICCGEGYYSSEILKNKAFQLYGFDLSREMVRLAAKRKLPASFFVSNISKIPMKDESCDLAFHFFAPFHEKEFSRILKSGGKLLTAVPGKNHLFQLKEKIYDKPYKNDESLPQTEALRLIRTHKAEKSITLTSKEDIQNLFMMTPYYYRTSQKDRKKIENLDFLEVTTQFVIGEYEKQL